MPAPAVGPQSAARPLSLAALSESWLASFVSGNTRDAYARDLLGFVEWCADHRISPMGSGVDTFERYRDDCLRMGASPATVSRRLAALSSFYAYAARLLRTGSSNPLESVTRPAPDGGTQRTLTPAEVEQPAHGRGRDGAQGRRAHRVVAVGRTEARRGVGAGRHQPEPFGRFATGDAGPPRRCEHSGLRHARRPRPSPTTSPGGPPARCSPAGTSCSSPAPA